VNETVAPSSQGLLVMKNVVVALTLTCMACSSYTPVYSPSEAVGMEIVRIERQNGQRFVIHQPTQEEMVDAFKWARSVEVRESDPGRTALLMVSILAGVGLLIGLSWYALSSWHPRF
jgi:hypothetical protein